MRGYHGEYECLLGSDYLLMKDIVIKVASADRAGEQGIDQLSTFY